MFCISIIDQIHFQDRLVAVLDYQTCVQEIPGSISGISSLENQVVSDVKDHKLIQ